MKKIFQNWIVAGIATAIAFFVFMGLSLMGLGMLMGLSGHPTLGIITALGGLVTASAALSALGAGWTHFEINPLEGGVMTFWGRAIKINGKTVVVKGDVILADWFPVFLGAARVNLQNKEWKFDDMDVLSVEKKIDGNREAVHIPLKGSVTLTVSPDEEDMADFVQSGGNLDAIKDQVRPIVYRETQKKITYHDNGDGTKGLSMVRIAQEGNIISDELFNIVNGTAGNPGLFEQRDFGIKCKKVQVDFPVPDKIKDSMLDAGSIDYENAARSSEYQADADAAKMLKTMLEDGDKSGKPISPKESLDALVELRLVRDGNVKRLQTENKGDGKSGTIVVGEVKF